MKTNEAGIAIIKHREDLRLVAYLDQKRGKWTIGWGSTRDVTPDMRITEAEADERLRDDLADAEATVSRLVKIELTSNEFSALVSFTFNEGGGRLLHSTLLKFLNHGNKTAAAREFPKWVYVGGKISQWEVDRRNEEMALFLTPNETAE